ncbi:MAG: fibronectin type III domain-containing protein [Nitrospirae bacterium]|nr:fibronectin type III domain-containing protein [Nitrospirota bacterium]
MGISRNQLRLINATPLLFHALKCLVALGISATVQLLSAQPEALALSLSPTSLSFTGTQGTTAPLSQPVTFWKSGSRTKSWTVSSPVSWATVNPASGSITTEKDTVSVSINLAGMAPGQYTTSIMITTVGPNGGVGKTAIPVSLTVAPSVSATGFTASPSSLAFSGTVGGPNTTGAIIVSNTGTTSLTVTWSEAVSWLIDVQPGSTQTIAAGQTATFTTTASSSGLAAGTYSGAATISGGGITKQIPVSLILSGTTATPSIRLTPTSLAFTGMAGGTNPAGQAFTLANPTGGTLTWTTSDNATWLALSAASGTTTTEVDSVNATVNLAGLAAGTYNATITITATGATNSPQVVPVSLTVSASTASSATLTWTANTDSDLAGYKIYSGTQSGMYGAPVSTGKVTSYVFTNLTKGTTYFFTVTAYDTAGNESPHAPEVSKSIF